MHSAVSRVLWETVNIPQALVRNSHRATGRRHGGTRDSRPLLACHACQKHSSPCSRFQH